MKQRTYKQLLTILLESLKKGNKEGYFNMGLCGELENLLHKSETITLKEYYKVSNYIDNNKPTARNKYKNFFNDKDFTPDMPWWWGFMHTKAKYRNKRIKFIQALINNL